VFQPCRRERDGLLAGCTDPLTRRVHRDERDVTRERHDRAFDEVYTCGN